MDKQNPTRQRSVGNGRPLSFRRCDLGLSNQKLALLGLFSQALWQRRPVVLPPWSVFAANGETNKLVPFEHAYRRDSVQNFCAAYGIEVIDEPDVDYEDIGFWHAFTIGGNRIEIDFQTGESTINSFIGHFFQSLHPVIVESDIFKKLRSIVFDDLKIELTSQMRIEVDWLEYSERRSTWSNKPVESYIPNFQTILGKISRSFQFKERKIYVVCDESRLPLPKEEIRDKIERDYRISLFWKSDILSREELSMLSLLDMSIIDFEMAICSPAYVGLSDSGLTFLAAYEHYVRTRKMPEHRYIYNSPSDFLQERCDSANQLKPEGVADKIHARTALVPGSEQDCFWPLQLTAHISDFGDFSTIATPICGVKGNALVCGVPGDFRRIEGFKLDIIEYAPCGIEYKAILQNGLSTPWVEPGNFVGTRGKAQALIGFAVRLTGTLAGRFECLSAGAFAGHDDIVVARDENDCVAPLRTKLEALQVIIRSVSFWDR